MPELETIGILQRDLPETMIKSWNWMRCLEQLSMGGLQFQTQTKAAIVQGGTYFVIFVWW